MHKKCGDYLQTGAHFKHEGEKYSNPVLGFIIDTYSKFNRSWSESFTPYFNRLSDIIIEHDNVNLLPELGIDGKILLTPGHTEDSLSVIIGKAAFVGDAARNMLNFAGTPYQPILLYDLEACYKSWSKLIEEEVNVICPAHGKTFAAKKLKVMWNRSNLII